MKVAHVRERFAPAGTRWRLAVALDTGPHDAPTQWIDLEPARRRAVRAKPALEHDSVVHRRPVTTLDDHLAADLRHPTAIVVVQKKDPPRASAILTLVMISEL